jgi:hypothetical protein
MLNQSNIQRGVTYSIMSAVKKEKKGAFVEKKCDFKEGDIVYLLYVDGTPRYYEITKITAKRARAVRLYVTVVEDHDIRAVPAFSAETAPRRAVGSIDLPIRKKSIKQYITLVRDGMRLRQMAQFVVRFNPRDSAQLVRLQTGGSSCKLSLDELLTVPKFAAWLRKFESF